MPKGTIINILRDKGFGFISSEDNKVTYFFHKKGVAQGYQFETLQLNDSVEFGLCESPVKPGQQVACDVKPAIFAAGYPRTPQMAIPHKAHQASTEKAKNDGGTILPYGFVPIDLDHAVSDTPVWHNGTDGGELLCGEILCELEALTPLLPGNMRYIAEHVEGSKLHQWGFENVGAEKQIAEPLRLPDGRVVISGSAIKGMIRQSLGALTSAPMERVAEHHYSYRPNLDFNRPEVKEKYVVRPALVVAAKNDGWEIEVFANPREVLFVRKEAEEIIRRASTNGVLIGRIKGIEREEIQQRNKPPRTTNHLIRSGATMSLSHRLATYKGGMDGKGLLAAAFQKKRGSSTYDLALVPQQPGNKLEISAELYQRYLRDQKQIIANNKIGHLTAHPLEFDVAKVEKGIKENADISPGQLIYVEVTTDASGIVTERSEVVSCGHHFRYRWAYTSSVRNKAGRSRVCLTPMDCEQSVSNEDKDIKPERLTGARLLFGYVRDDKKNPVGKGVYERLAGRIAINHAVSEAAPKFLGEPETGYCIPLRILGQPKPSAWEFYLQQPEKPEAPLVTYGDLPGDPGGELAGRKFYRHQEHTTLDDIRATTAEEERSDQATLARFICAPKTQFKFAVRFSSLRDWELGALLAVLEPHLLLPDGNPERYAHKLGLGRPLGMGSVRISRQGLRLRLEKGIGFLDSTDADNRVTLALKALQGRLNPRIKEQWLNVHEFCGKHLAYPLEWTKLDGQQVQTIYAWHTDVRRQYSKLRRDKTADWRELSNKVRKAT